MPFLFFDHYSVFSKNNFYYFQNTIMVELQELLENTSKELDKARVKLDTRDVRIKELEKIIESQKGQYNLRHKTPKTTMV